MSLRWTILVTVGSAFVIANCSNSVSPITPTLNPMPEIWASICGKIDILEAERADETRWSEASVFCEPISSVQKMRGLVRQLNLSAAEEGRLVNIFEKSSAIRLYGFECNFHALVFFDGSGNAWKVIKWS